MSFELMSAAVAVELPCNQKMVLLMLANRTHSDMGYCYPSIKRLASDCGLSETATKNAIKALVAMGIVFVTAQSKDGIKAPNRYTLSIPKVEKHDGRETPIDRRETPGGGSPDAGGVGRQTPIKHKEETVSETQARFDTFWKAYPKKMSKPDAIKAFNKLKVTDELLQRMLSAISIQRQSEGWLKKNGQFIPYPATWLSAARWEDESESFDSPQERFI